MCREMCREMIIPFLTLYLKEMVWEETANILIILFDLLQCPYTTLVIKTSNKQNKNKME